MGKFLQKSLLWSFVGMVVFGGASALSFWVSKQKCDKVYIESNDPDGPLGYRFNCYYKHKVLEVPSLVQSLVVNGDINVQVMATRKKTVLINVYSPNSGSDSGVNHLFKNKELVFNSSFKGEGSQRPFVALFVPEGLLEKFEANLKSGLINLKSLTITTFIANAEGDLKLTADNLEVKDIKIEANSGGKITINESDVRNIVGKVNDADSSFQNLKVQSMDWFSNSGSIRVNFAKNQIMNIKASSIFGKEKGRYFSDGSSHNKVNLISILGSVEFR